MNVSVAQIFKRLTNFNIRREEFLGVVGQWSPHVVSYRPRFVGVKHERSRYGSNNSKRNGDLSLLHWRHRKTGNAPTANLRANHIIPIRPAIAPGLAPNELVVVHDTETWHRANFNPIVSGHAAQKPGDLLEANLFQPHREEREFVNRICVRPDGWNACIFTLLRLSATAFHCSSVRDHLPITGTASQPERPFSKW